MAAGKRICVIGAGPAGLAALAQLQAAFPDAGGAGAAAIRCYERSSRVGGLWNYDWRTGGTDRRGGRLRASMYADMWNNVPREAVELPDYTWRRHLGGKAIPSFVRRRVIGDYIVARADALGLRRHVRFGRAVRTCAVAGGGQGFDVTVRDLEDGNDNTHSFDHVIVATGHFSIPNVPHIEGIGAFPHLVLHSGNVRRFEAFRGHHVLVVGAGFSAEDVAVQALKYGARSVCVSSRHGFGYDWPAGIVETGDVRELAADGTAVFADGSTGGPYTSVVLCTGFLHRFPFMHKALRLRSANTIHQPLYDGVVFPSAGGGRLFYMGMQNQVLSTPMFEAQAAYIAAAVAGRIEPPPPSDMEAAVRGEGARVDALGRDIPAWIDYQNEYVDALVQKSGYPHKLSRVQMCRKCILADRAADFAGYRSERFRSIYTGDLAAPAQRSWWQQTTGRE